MYTVIIYRIWCQLAEIVDHLNSACSICLIDKYGIVACLSRFLILDITQAL